MVEENGRALLKESSEIEGCLVDCWAKERRPVVDLSREEVL